MKIGLGLDVCDLGEDSEKGRQWIVATSGSDRSIAVSTLEYGPKTGYAQLRPYTVLRDVHPFSMTKICFSTFHPPRHPISANVPPQKVKLASVSMGNTVAVHTFDLAPFPPLSRTPRYVLTLPGESSTWDVLYSVSVTVLFVAVALAVMLGIAEHRGVLPRHIITAEWLPLHIREAVFPSSSPVSTKSDVAPLPQLADVPVVQVQDPQQPAEQQQDRTLSSMVEMANVVGSDGESSPVVVVRSDGPGIFISIQSKSESKSDSETGFEPESSSSSAPPSSPSATDSGPGLLRRWAELDENERAQWKQRLVDAGYWAIGEGEGILTGVFFGEVNEVIGDTVRHLS